MIYISQKNDQDQPVDSAKKAVCFATHTGRFILASFGCGILGAISGAILGALAAFPFFPPAGSFIGSILGAIGGFVGGFVGGGIGGPHRFLIGGIVGAVVSIAVYPFIILLVIPPGLALGVGYLFGKYLDQEVNKEKPRFFLARMMKWLMSGMDSYPSWIKISYCIVIPTALIIILFLVDWNYIFT